MPIVIAHGQPKSGSTFLFSTALRISEYINQCEYHKYAKKTVGEDFASFAPTLDVADLVAMEAKVPVNETLVIKTHAPLSEDIESLIDGRRFIAFTSFRDPRDSSLSILNVAAKERATGKSRWFTQFEELEQLKRPAMIQWQNTIKWTQNPQVLTIPYYLIAAAERAAIMHLTTFLGARHLGSVIAAEMASRRSAVTEFNKGIQDRFVDDLSVEDLILANKMWADLIKEYETATNLTMQKLGHRMLAIDLAAKRDARMRARLQDA